MTVATAVAHEAGHAEHSHYTTTGLEHRKIAVWAFIGSECMLFASLISTYLIYKGRSKVGPWPHEWGCKVSNVIGDSAAAVAAKGCAAADVMKPILDIPVTSNATDPVTFTSAVWLASALLAGVPLPATVVEPVRCKRPAPMRCRFKV